MHFELHLYFSNRPETEVANYDFVLSSVTFDYNLTTCGYRITVYLIDVLTADISNSRTANSTCMYLTNNSKFLDALE